MNDYEKELVALNLHPTTYAPLDSPETLEDIMSIGVVMLDAHMVSRGYHATITKQMGRVYLNKKIGVAVKITWGLDMCLSLTDEDYSDYQLCYEDTLDVYFLVSTSGMREYNTDSLPLLYLKHDEYIVIPL